MAHHILFPIETASRELLYKVALCLKLSQKGHICYVGSKAKIAQATETLYPIVYFDKGYHKGVSEGIYRRIKANGGLIVNLDEEGGVDYEENQFLLGRYDEPVFRNCDLVFLWGEKQLEILKGARENLSFENVVVSGHPRFELLKEPFHSLYQMAALILFMSNPRFLFFIN